MPSKPSTATEMTVDERLHALEVASDERRAELRALAATLPASVSRRALIEAAARDLRAAPNKGDIARRGAMKVARTPVAVARRILRRS